MWMVQSAALGQVTLSLDCCRRKWEADSDILMENVQGGAGLRWQRFLSTIILQ